MIKTPKRGPVRTVRKEVRLITSQQGQAIGFCSCGCGGTLYERIYTYDYRRGGPIVRRPTRLPGHGPSQSEWRQRRDMVPAEPIINLLEGFKQEHNLTWKQVSDIVGIYYPASRLRRHRFLAKTRAEQMLRAMRSYRLQQS